jgi:rubrerythrin
MGNKNEAALEALQKALGLEQRGHTFYLEAVERTIDPKGKAMFRSLADDEVLHANIIQRQIDALQGGEGWTIPEGVTEVTADLETPLFPKGQVELERAIRPDASETDALLFALKIENDSFNLYTEQAKAAQDPNAKLLYEFLVDAERTHFNLLMINYESLSTNAGWV